MTDPRLFLAIYIFAFIMGVVFGYASRWKEVSDKDKLIEFQGKQWLLTQGEVAKLDTKIRRKTQQRKNNGRFA